MPLTLEQAAQETGKSKRAISQAIKAEKLPATKGKRGQWQIDPAALFRVFPKEETSGVRENQEREKLPEGSALEGRLAQLEQAVQEIRQQLAQEILPLREELTQAQKQIQALERQLAQETEERRRLAERLAELQPAKKRGLWPRWFYRGG
jgi:predicted RNase H-like nuclease (RuvC/YqgF family)